MPITDNSFTADELSAAAAANPEILKVVTTHLTGNKFVVRSEAENTEFLKNYESKIIGDKTREHAAAIEKDVFELTGIPKEGDEKYYDYLKRAVTGTKAILDKATKDLEEARKGGNSTEADRTRISKLEKALDDAKKEHQTALSGKDSEISKVKASNVVERVLVKLRSTYKPNMGDDIIEMVESTTVEKLLSKSEFRKGADGKDILVFLDESGNIRDNPTTLKPLTAEEILTDQLKSLIDVGKKQPGTGTGGNDDAGKGGNEGSKFTGLPSDVKTKVQLTEYLQKLGIMDGTEEYIKIFDEHGAKLPLR